MNFRTCLVICFAMYLFVGQVYGGACADARPFPPGLQPLSVGEIKLLQKQVRSAKSFSLNFSQTISSTIRKSARPVSGTAYFQQPSLVRWVKDKPKEEYFFDGKELNIWKPEQNLVVKFSQNGSQAQEFGRIAGMVLSFEKLIEGYEIMAALQDMAAKQVYLNLSPKLKQSIQEVTVDVNLKPYFVKKVCWSHQDGKVVNYLFSDAKYYDIAEKDIKFSKPQGVKVEVWD